MPLSDLPQIKIIKSLFRKLSVLIMLPENYVNRIILETGLNRQEIKSMVQEKIVESKGLISEGGALYVVARELAVKISGVIDQSLRLDNWILDKNKKNKT